MKHQPLICVKNLSIAFKKNRNNSCDWFPDGKLNVYHNCVTKNIEESKLILNENEVNLQIENYNNQLKNFTILVDEFNLHYQNQISKIREKVLKEIIQLLEKYAIKNKIDLILDSTSYLIASNSIDITEKINNDLKEIIIKLEYSDFETN